MKDNYITIAQAKESTTMSYNALKKAIRLGQLESRFVNGRYLFKYSWLDKWIGGKK